MRNTEKLFLLETLSVISVGCLAFSVSLGVALTSLSCLLLVLITFVKFVFNCINKLSSESLDSQPTKSSELFTIWAILLGLVWIVLSTIWSIASWNQIGKELIRSARLLVSPFVFYVISTRPQALIVLTCWVYGQMFVLISSYGLWLGLPEPWATSGYAVTYFTPYSNTLDQPIMSSVAVALIWFFRDHFCFVWGKALGIKERFHAQLVVIFLLLLFSVNVCFLMIGRSGMLSMIIVMTSIGLQSLPTKSKKYALFFPFLIFGALYFSSERFHDRIQKIPYEISEFRNNKIETSQAIRLEFWYRSIQAIEAKPILGYGVGSWPSAYILALRGERGFQADSPHQQFLLWWVEEGVVGFLFLIAIYLSILRDSCNLENPAKFALVSLMAVLTFTSLMNCPLQGAGISEFFCVAIGALLVFQKK